MRLFSPCSRLAAPQKSGETGYAVCCGSINQDMPAGNEILLVCLVQGYIRWRGLSNLSPWRSEDDCARTRPEQVLKAFDGWASRSGG